MSGKPIGWAKFGVDPPSTDGYKSSAHAKLTCSVCGATCGDHYGSTIGNDRNTLTCTLGHQWPRQRGARRERASECYHAAQVRVPDGGLLRVQVPSGAAFVEADMPISRVLHRWIKHTPHRLSSLSSASNAKYAVAKVRRVGGRVRVYVKGPKWNRTHGVAFDVKCAALTW